MIKLVAIDLDDTLLTKNKEITNENIEAINKLNSLGLHVVIASGRPYFRVRPILDKLNLSNKNNYVISYNGSNISNGDNSIKYKELVLSNDDLNRIIDVINKYQLHYTVYYKNQVFATKILEEIKDKPVFKNLVFTFDTEENIRKLPFANKVIIAEKAELISKYRDEIECILNKDYNLLRSTPNFLEILNIDANKGLALRDLSKILNLSYEEVMAIGDEENDLPMFKYATFKIAMGNANETLKNEATFITLDQENSGVAYAINKHIKWFNNIA